MNVVMFRYLSDKNNYTKCDSVKWKKPSIRWAFSDKRDN